MKLVFYPVFNDSDLLTDHYFRLHWYLSPFHEQIEKIVLPRQSDNLTIGALPEYLDELLPSLEGNLPVTFQTVKTDADFLSEINEADCVILWSVDANSPYSLPSALKGKRVIRIDHRHLQFSGSFYLKFPEAFEHLQNGYIERSQKIFERINKRCTNKVGYIFGTGPGLAKAKDTDFSDGVSIACNSTVRNHELLDRLKPPLIVVADPIFHAGPSSYAAAFRKELIRALDRYDADLIVPMRDYHIYLHHLPDRFTDRIAAVPFKAEETPNLDLSQSFHVTSTGNVLTLFLLPLAATFFKEIRIYGCDGRPLEANDYFWSHDKASQFNDKMDDIQIAHPAFFDIDYDDYYQTHCKTLDAWLDAAETQGKRITNNTPSYIPALAKRTVEGVGAPSSSQMVSIIMPAYNAARFIEEAARSVIDQHYTDWELLIVDDRSTDETAAIAKHLATKDRRIHYLQNSKKGVSSARNTGIEAAKGRFITFLDADDILNQRSIVTRIEALSANEKIELVHSTVQWIDERGRDLERTIGVPRNIGFSDMTKNAAVINTVMGEARLIKKFRFDETLGNGEDWLFLARILRSGVRSHFVAEGKATLRIWSNSTTATAMRNHVSKLENVVDWLHSHCEEENVAARYQAGLTAHSKQSTKLFFKRSYLIWAIFCGDEEAARDVINEIKSQHDVLDRGRKYWLGSVNAAGVRYFRKRERELRNLDLSIRDGIFETVLKLQLRAEIPALASAISEIFASTLQTAPKNVEQDNASQTARDDAVKSLPRHIQMPIFLPTDRVPLGQQITGLSRVAELYKSELDETYRPRLRALKTARRRRRCFVIGNGPSINKTDLALLKGETTFATNGFFLKMPELDWAPTYYVVEDHLVAEDRATEINKLHGPIKLFPANLRYVLEPNQDTIYFDHRPRISFPDGFDFSFDAQNYTYAGGTVTFTCLELAAYLGYEEIYLIGVDADYAIPKDANISGPGRTKEIDMQSDDPNHFHPDYFGKGKRWHEPNVSVMVDAYEEAKDACDARNIKIFNATIGGKLEVFPRVEFESLFPWRSKAPRLLVIDQTLIADGSATGELKANLFDKWSPNSLLQLYDAGYGVLGFLQGGETQTFDGRAASTASHIDKRLAAFRPEVILYRQLPNTPELHKHAKTIIDKSKLPLVTWIMDDWPASCAQIDPKHADLLDADWRRLLARSELRLSIGDAMSTAFGKRYGMKFESFANGVDPADWVKACLRDPDAPIKVRFAGSLAKNMTLSSVVMVAQAVESLANAGVSISFEIKTRGLWRTNATAHFSGMSHTHFTFADLAPEEYRAWLSNADIVVIAYNFDDHSQQYVQYSVANKLPECLACGATLLAVGPKDTATMTLLEQIDCGVRVTEGNQVLLESALADLAASPQNRFQLAQKAQETAFTEFNINTIQTNFVNSIAVATSPHDLNLSPREAHLTVDETAVVARLCSTRRGREHIMVDVGAHYGTSAGYFHMLDWTIHCFEPDPENRKMLKKRYSSAENVIIDTRAVSDKPMTGIPFFTSKQSTGISGLSAFHKTHKKTGRVDVTTIAEIISDRGLSRIDFLKIDVEGFDFSVLKGVPWGGLEPDIIECEFEDAKTVPMGHNWRDIADYLRDKGYAVYISEWHPIIRYGIRHDWRRIIAHDGAEIAKDAWGNLLAFKSDPGLPAIRQAFSKLISPPPTETTPPQGAPKKASPALAVKRPFYAYFGERLRTRAPRVFALLRIIRRAMAGIWRRRTITAPALAALAVPLLVSLLPDFKEYQAVIWGGTAFATAMFAILFLAFWTYLRISALTAETTALRASVTVQKDKAENQLKSYSRLASEKKALEDRLTITNTELAKVRLTVEEDLKHSLKITNIKINKMVTAAEKLKAEITQTTKTRLQNELDIRFSDVTRLRERVASSERQIGVLRYPDAPRCMVLFGHHKCGSRFFRMQVFSQIAEMTGARIRKYEVLKPPFHYSQMDDLDLCNMSFDGLGLDKRDVVLFSNATKKSLEKIQRSTENWKGLRILRDPRQVLVSDFFHHRGAHKTDASDSYGWIWDDLVRDQPILRELSEEDGLLHELDNISKGIIERQLLEPFDDERVMTIKLEEFAEDPAAWLMKISKFLNVSDVAGINLALTGANKDSGPWRQHFTSKLREVFKERYGQALIDMGYAKDMDW